MKKAVHAYLIFLFVLFAGCSTDSAEVSQVCFNNKCYTVELALTPAEQQKGLMYRKSLPENTGMLFIFSYPGKYPFWMKNTLISLDMIWLDHSRKVVHIEHNVPPCKEEICSSYASLADALYVLELNAGQAKLWPIDIGSEIIFK